MTNTTFPITKAPSEPRQPVTTGQTIRLHILRCNPADPASDAHLQTFELEQTDGMTLFIALTEIREKHDPSLQFDFVCRAGICGSCAMVINGRPGLACRTLTKKLGPTITLAPLPVFELIGDLSVNTGKWMRGMSERLEGWLHMPSVEPSEAFGLVQLEAMACARPVVGCELHNGATYVNQHGVTGLVVPPRDPAALAQGLNTLLADSALAERMGAAGRLRACEDFSLEKMWSGTLQVYREVVGRDS